MGIQRTNNSNNNRSTTTRRKKPSLPAPTESLFTTSTTDDTEEISSASAYSIPDDGAGVTIPIVPKRRYTSSDSNSNKQQQQTSLLIEYFEKGAGEGKNRHSTSSNSITNSSRPNIRVRVTPSGAARKSSSTTTAREKEDYGGIYTRRIISLIPKRQPIIPGDSSASSDSSTVALDHRNLSPSSHDNLLPKMNQLSEVSSMPPDSMLDASSLSRRKSLDDRNSSFVEEEDDEEDNEYLKTPRTRRRSRSVSKERIAHRVAEKLSQRDVSASTKQRRAERSSSALSKSSNNNYKYHQRDDLDSTKSSLLSASVHSSNKSSSINNPRLLETVEDAIRRLILPELKELKKDNHKSSSSSSSKLDRHHHHHHRRDVSKGDGSRRRSSSSNYSGPQMVKPTVVLKRDSKDEGATVVAGGRRRRSSRDLDGSMSGKSSRRSSRTSLPESNTSRHHRKSSGSSSNNNNGFRETPTGTTALTAAALSHHNSQSSMGSSSKRSSNHTRPRKSNSREEGGGGSSRRISSPPPTTESIIHEEDEEDEEEPHVVPGIATEVAFKRYNVPRMPMHSEIDSGLTRDSLLSEQTDTSSQVDDNNSNYQNNNNTVSRGLAIQASGTATNGFQPQYRSPLGVHFSNTSHNDLSLRDEDNHSPMSGSTLSSGGVDKQQSRALSPIPSISSHGSEQTQVEGSGGRDLSAEKGVQESLLSIETMSSAPSTELARATRPDGGEGARSPPPPHPLQDDMDEKQSLPPGSWPQQQQQQQEEQRSREGEEEEELSWNSPTRPSDSEVSYLERLNKGQHVVASPTSRASPKFFGKTPVVVESAVASVLDPSSMVTFLSPSKVNNTQPDAGGQRSLPVNASSSSAASNGQSYYGLSREQVQETTTPPWPTPTRSTSRDTPSSSAKGSGRELPAEAFTARKRQGTPPWPTPVEDLSASREVHSPGLSAKTSGGSGGTSRGIPEGNNNSGPWQQQQQDAGSYSFPKRMGVSSPPQSVAESIDEDAEEEDVHHGGGVEDIAGIDDRRRSAATGSESSEINTNPSIIQGPIGGTREAGDSSSWQQQQRKSSPPARINKELPPYPEGSELMPRVQPPLPSPSQQQQQQQEAYDDFGNGETYDANGFFADDDYDDVNDQPPMFEKAGLRDDDDVYPAAGSPMSGNREIGVGAFDDYDDGGRGGEGLEALAHTRNLSGYSHGVGSPIYDSATGRGIERIKSKDVIALMDHVSLFPPPLFSLS